MAVHAMVINQSLGDKIIPISINGALRNFKFASKAPLGLSTDEYNAVKNNSYYKHLVQTNVFEVTTSEIEAETVHNNKIVGIERKYQAYVALRKQIEAEGAESNPNYKDHLKLVSRTIDGKSFVIAEPKDTLLQANIKTLNDSAQNEEFAMKYATEKAMGKFKSKNIMIPGKKTNTESIGLEIDNLDDTDTILDFDISEIKSKEIKAMCKKLEISTRGMNTKVAKETLTNKFKLSRLKEVYNEVVAEETV